MIYQVLTKFLTKQRLCTALLLYLTIGIQVQVQSQDRYPREYTNPDEIVAFDRSTNYEEAIEVINQFYQEYQNKFIIDQTQTSGPIGVSLPAMHWRDALSFILRLKGLMLIEHDEFVEIVTQESQLQAEEKAPPPGALPPEDAITLNTREVRINATFFEGNRRALQEIGVDWSTLTNNVPDNINEIVSGDGVEPDLGVPQADFGDQFVSVNSYNASNVSQNVFNALVNLGDMGTGISVQALFSAFEADNLGEVLATPFTKVMDGQEGRVQVGQDFSIKQRDIAGNVTDQFFNTGTILTVTPTVYEINDTAFIHLDIEVERSSAQPDAISTIINKQEATTQALLLDGEATAIAGLYRTEETKVRRGVPILKDLPWWFLGLRYLFGYNSNDYVENELVIIVQASLEKPLTERMAERFATKREVLDSYRDYMRNDLDQVFLNELATTPASVQVEPTEQPEEVSTQPVVNKDDRITQVDDTQGMTEEPDTVTLEPNPIVEEEEVLPPEKLTKEQQELVKQLSLPVEDPELMVVVPRAFSLDEYLLGRKTGEVQETTQEEEAHYFVIGGSFIVKNNANRFNESLKEQGYETRVLFHPRSRFNFVAYKGFANLDDAVEYLDYIRREVNSEAWLFVLPSSN